MCVSCTMLEPINQAAESYAIKLFNVLAPNALLIFQAAVGCWLVWNIIQHGILNPNLNLQRFFKPLLIFTLITLLLRGHGMFWEFIYKPLHESTISLLSTIMKANQHGHSVNNLNGLLEIVERSILNVANFCERIYGDTGWNPLPKILGLILLLPFVFLWAIFMIFTVEYLFKLLVVSALAPLLIIAAAFHATRSHAFASFKVVLQGVLTICISVIAMSITLLAVESAINTLHLLNGDAGVVNQFMSFTGPFCSLFALGLVASFFQLKAPTIASNIMGGGQDGPGISGMIAGTAATVGTMVAKGVGRKISSVTGNVVRGASSVSYESIRNKFKGE